MLTVLSDISNNVEGLDTGANDYLSKPFDIKELLAHVRTLGCKPSDLKSTNLLSIGDITLNLISFLLTSPSNSHALSKRESALFEVFLNNPNILLPRNIILSKVWDPYSSVAEGNLDNYIHFLRRRLKTINSTLKVPTSRGIGYTLKVANVM